MRKINRIVRKDIGLGFLRGCSIPQFVDRVTKLVSDCLDQINEFYDVLSTVKDGKDGKDGEQGPKGDNGIGVPSGGRVNQVLIKKSNNNYDTEWANIQSGGNVTSVNGKTGDVNLSAEDVDALPANTPLFSGSYNDLSDKPTIPAPQVNADWNANSGIAQILNKPTIPTVPANVSAFINDAGYLTQHQDISSKEDVTTIVSPVNATDATLPITALTCEVGKYYRIDVAVDTLAVTLPAMTDLTTVRTVVIYLTAGTTPAVTISSTAPTGGSAPDVYYQDGYDIEAGSTYEINALFNGTAWIIASVEIVKPTNE